MTTAILIPLSAVIILSIRQRQLKRREQILKAKQHYKELSKLYLEWTINLLLEVIAWVVIAVFVIFNKT